MTTRNFILFASAFASTTAIALTDQSLAASDDFCKEYAADALSKYEEAQELGCPELKYPVWSTDFDHHYNWCRTVSEAEALAGGRIRTDALDQCRVNAKVSTADIPETATGVDNISPCAAYAESAVAQQEENLERSCGFVGPQWNANRDDHYNWCVRGENIKFAEGQRAARQQALDKCAATAKESGTSPTGGTRFEPPTPPALSFVDGAAFPGGTLMIDAVRATIALEPDCDDLRASLVSMIHGGGFAHATDGSYNWSAAEPATLSLDDSRVTKITNDNRLDLNAQIKGFTKLHKNLRVAQLSSEFQATALSRQKLEAVTRALSANLRSDRLAKFKDLKQAETGAVSASPARPNIADVSKAKAMARINSVCALADSDSKNTGTMLWEDGYVFLLGRNFGTTPGIVELQYTACGGDKSQSCEDRRMSGQPLPTNAIRLQPISQFAWADSLIGLKLPSILPKDLTAGVAGPRITIRPAGGAVVSSPPVTLNYIAPHVWTLKTDSGFDPGGLALDGHWVHWQDPKAVRHEIFWLWSQKLVQGAGLIRINCEGCPKGKRLQAAHLASPGDNIYIYGDGFGDKPGRIFLTYKDPTTPGFTVKTAASDIPVVAGEANWWRDDRIHIRILAATPPPAHRTFPSLVIIDNKGRWVSGRYGLSFAPEMAVKVVSGKTWFDLGTGEDDAFVAAPDNSAMIVSHPTGGCASLGPIPIDTNERGDDDYFYKARPPAGVKVISAEFAHLDPEVSDSEYFSQWAKGMANAAAKSGIPGLFLHAASEAVESMLRSLGGDQGAFSIYPRKSNWKDADDPRAYVSWINTCMGPYANKTLNYSARFVLVGPKHILYP